jgi:PIN domain nuclease of toxin-antitoxin system
MVLLDTCTLLWLAGDPSALSQPARDAIDAAEDGPAVSAVAAFEVAIKWHQGKLTLPLPPDQWYARALAGHGVREIPVDGLCALRAAGLPPIHHDPCDRFLIATAQLHKLPIVTPDRIIAQYDGLRVIW